MNKLTCYGGVGSVTGANFLLEADGKRILVDCGLQQGSANSDEVNEEAFPYDPSSIDALFITHAHIDHIGRIGKLVKDGFQGTIYSTALTKDIARLMLEDAAKIMERNERSSEATSPLYAMKEVEKALSIWHTLEYHDPKEVLGLTVELFDGGHILGSAMYQVTLPGTEGRKILFSGDIGNSPSTLLKNTEEVKGLSYILMDSVYGDRNHEHRSEREDKFKRVVEETIKRSGTLLIPVFSLERTQVVLRELDKLFETKAIPSVPVFLDSPLAIKITALYERASKNYNESTQKEIREGDNVFDFDKLKKTAQIRDSHEITRTHGPKIILAGSGMSTAGRIVGHEETFLPDPNATILFIGYQAAGTLGRQIEEGLKSVVINGHPVKVKARVEKISGYSGHADSDSLVKFVSHSRETLKKVFVAMGEPRASIFLAQRLRDELGVDALVPERGKSYELN
jgi:metallo-beta-lactamase family protein